MKNKKIVYVSNVCSSKKLEALFLGDFRGVSQQIQRYHRLLVSGLSKIPQTKVDVLSALPISRENCTYKRIAKEKSVEGIVTYQYLGAINTPLWKKLGDFMGGFVSVLGYSRKETVLLVDILDVSIVLGSILAAKIKKIKVIGIVTDIPDYLFVIGKLHAKLANFNIRLCDAYVLLTKQMAEVVNKRKSKPFLVMEGHVPTEVVDTDKETQKYKEEVCLYAGILDIRYGVADLVKGFLQANIPNAKLHLYGEGNYKEELLKIAKENPSICYLGVKQNAKIVAEEKKVSLLINPRPTNQEFVKYSFPSKNLEYMVSGTPMLSTCLPGMPEEYNSYIFLIKDETAAGIATKLKEIFAMPREERAEFGKRAQQFVKTYKSEEAQANKLRTFIEML